MHNADWTIVKATRIWPAPYDDDHVLVVGDVEVVVHVNERNVCFTVYPEPQRPTDPVTGAIYGRNVVAGYYLDCEPTDPDRARAVAKAKAISERVIDMLDAGVAHEVIYRESGSAAWWDAWRAREYQGVR
jgi:hypothetical protein